MTNKLFNRRNLLLGGYFLLVGGLAYAALLSPLLLRIVAPAPQVGEVVNEDIVARSAITYVSEVLTEQKRIEAEARVGDVYTDPDTAVARRQLELLRSTLAYISNVRADSFATLAQRQSDLEALEAVDLSQETSMLLLLSTEQRWQAILTESIAVLERLFRSPIRADELENTRNQLPLSISLTLSEDQARAVAEIVSSFLVPNTSYSEVLTAAERQAARQAVPDVSRSYAVGQTVVRSGQVLTEVDVEALLQLGLVQPPLRGRDLGSAAALVVVMGLFLLLYLRRFSGMLNDNRRLMVIPLLFLFFLITARLVIPDHVIVPYAFPLAAHGLIIASLFGAQLGIIISLPLAIMVAYGMPNTLEMTLFFMLGSLFGVLALARGRRIFQYFWAGLAVMLAGSLVVLIFYPQRSSADWAGMATLIGAAAFNGLAVAGLTIVVQYFLAQFLDLTTPLQLIELTRPDHAMLQKMLHEAPGTYQHSLQVANLAEQAAERIGADGLLTRVGALYHDIGKTANPSLFIENQLQGFANPHDSLTPLTSATLIIRHVTDGLALARQYRLPVRIRDFIAEHHGTTIARYQYTKAVNAVGGDESQVNIELYRYPGPRPKSRETAILMLADACEARFRADRPQDEEALHTLIRGMIDARVALGQLNDTHLTLHDLEQIAVSFTMTLRGLYHPRIQYPQQLPQPGEAIAIQREGIPADLAGEPATIPVPAHNASESLASPTQN